MLREMFGAQWTHGDEPSLGWIFALREMTPTQLRRGVDNLTARDDNHWPPNALEFKDLCLMDMDWEHKRLHYVPIAGIEDKTEKEKRRGMGIDELKKLRESVGL